MSRRFEDAEVFTSRFSMEEIMERHRIPPHASCSKCPMSGWTTFTWKVAGTPDLSVVEELFDMPNFEPAENRDGAAMAEQQWWAELDRKRA